VVVALCDYGFAVRGLHRLQVDTLASNTAMIRAASRAGFVPEGRLRRAAWVNGEFADGVILGMPGGKPELRPTCGPAQPSADQAPPDRPDLQD
jgi:RimJ/RimL family protein N-acetyltransferase